MNEVLSKILVYVPSYIPFIFIMVIVGLILYRAHVSEASFNLFHLIEDTTTGKGSLEKVQLLLGGLTVTWWFMELCVQNKATWEDAICYGGLLGLSKFANKWLDIKSQQPK